MVDNQCLCVRNPQRQHAMLTQLKRVSRTRLSRLYKLTDMELQAQTHRQETKRTKYMPVGVFGRLWIDHGVPVLLPIMIMTSSNTVGEYLAYVGLDPGPSVLNLVCQHCVIHHFLELVPNGMAQVAGCTCICQVVVPAGKHHSGEGEQLIAAHKSTVSFTLCNTQACQVEG